MPENSNFKITTSLYEGPLKKLLSLVEDRKLEITELSLSAVTADFISHINRLQQESNQNKDQDLKRLIADFLVIASKLLVIKSRALLPQIMTPEEEIEDAKDLETRLIIYREIKNASDFVSSLWHRPLKTFSREFLIDRPAVFMPTPELSVSKINSAINDLINRLHALQKEEAKIENSLIHSIADKVKEISNHLSQGPVSFHGLISNKHKSEVIAIFLAVLHLLRDESIKIKQSAIFDDIFISK